MDTINTFHGDFTTSPVNSFPDCNHGAHSAALPETQSFGLSTPVTAAEMGRKGGASRTLAKRLAAKNNGKLGGRPRKKQANALAPKDVPAAADVFINSKLWSTFSPERMAQYKKDVFNYFRQVGFPYYRLTPEEKEKEFRKLQGCDYTKIIEGDTITQTMHGLALAWSYHPHSWSVRCSDKRSPVETFRDDDLLRLAISKIIVHRENMSDASMRRMLKWCTGSQGVSNFRPTAAAAIYHELLPETGGAVWDMSSGFGGRLLGAFVCERVKKYIGTEPCKASHRGCEQMGAEFNQRGIGLQPVDCGSENYLPDPESLDVCFTSPPYFSEELYSDEPTQSCLKFPTRQEWMQKFMRPTLANCWYGLKPDGALAVNIAGVKSYPELERDFVALALEQGWQLVRTLRYSLSNIAGGGYKYEPVFVFKKGTA
jgi:hypothetical protein